MVQFLKRVFEAPTDSKAISFKSDWLDQETKDIETQHACFQPKKLSNHGTDIRSKTERKSVFNLVLELRSAGLSSVQPNDEQNMEFVA